MKRMSASTFDPKITIKCECGSKMLFQLPTSISSTVFETTNKYRGKKIVRGVQNMLKKRMKTNAAKYEYKDRIDKYGLDDAKDVIKKVERI